MPLDMDKVFPQVGAMIARFKADGAEREKHLRFALAELHKQADNVSRLSRKISAARTTWLAAWQPASVGSCGWSVKRK